MNVVTSRDLTSPLHLIVLTKYNRIRAGILMSNSRTLNKAIQFCALLNIADEINSTVGKTTLCTIKILSVE